MGGGCLIGQEKAWYKLEIIELTKEVIEAAATRGAGVRQGLAKAGTVGFAKKM